MVTVNRTGQVMDNPTMSSGMRVPMPRWDVTIARAPGLIWVRNKMALLQMLKISERIHSHKTS